MHKVGLIVAGLDPSSGAGILLDTRVFGYFKVPSCGITTALTVQNSCGAKYWLPTEEELFKGQLEELKKDFSIGAVKVGMVARASLLEILTENLRGVPMVVDPVMFSKNGKPLLDDPKVYLRMAENFFLITPNLDEALFLASTKEKEPYFLLNRLKERGFKNILLKGGHYSSSERVRDYLLTEKGEIFIFERRRFNKHPRGTGCALSSAITANLLKGLTLKDAVKVAQEFITEAIQKAQKLGKCHEILTF